MSDRPRGDDGGTLRLFVAAELPDSVRTSLAATADALRGAGATSGLRWVRPEGVHVTLKFLGAVPGSSVDAIVAALRGAAAGVDPFYLRPEGLGSFGGARNLRVVWVGVAGDSDALAALASRVEAALAPLGFPAEQRPFAAHLTLGRVRDDASGEERARLHGLIARVAPPAMASWRVDRISLMQSRLARGGAVYRALAELRLGGV